MSTETDINGVKLHTINVLEEVALERRSQDVKWGQQDHPWYNGASPWSYISDEWAAKHEVEEACARGECDYAGILTEEYHEALDAASLEQVRAELVQVAAVAVAAIESIDRNGR